MNRLAFVAFGMACAAASFGQANIIGFTRDIAVASSRSQVVTMPNGNFCIAIKSGTSVRVYVINRINQVIGLANLLGPGVGNFQLGALSVGSDNSIYVSTSYLTDVVVYRLNSTGGLLWTKTVNGGSVAPYYDLPTAHAFDNAGNLIVVGALGRAGAPAGGFCFGLRPTNAGLFVRNQLDGQAEAVAVGTDGKVHVACSGDYTGSYWQLNSAGVQTLLASLGTSERAYGIAVNPSGHVFIAGDIVSGVDRLAYFSRRDPATGGMVWGIINGGANSRYSTVAIDGSGNVYGAGLHATAGSSGSSYVKVDPASGGIYYSRSRLGSAPNPFGSYGGFFLDAYNEQYMVIDFQNPQTVELFKASATGVLRWNGYGGAADESQVNSAFHNPSGDTCLTSVRGGNLRINVVRQAPLAVVDNFSTPRNTVLNTKNVKTNDRFAVDASPSLVSGTLHGTVVVNPNGTFVYTPSAGYVGIDSFSYRITRAGLNTSTATVNLTVTP